VLFPWLSGEGRANIYFVFLTVMATKKKTYMILNHFEIIPQFSSIQEPSSDPYHEPAESIPYHPILFL
jgi:hypothetical protein